MSANTQPATEEQRKALVAKIEQKLIHKDVLNGKALILHYRVLLQDLPLAGHPGLLLDDHREAIEKLVDKAAGEDVEIVSIIGHTSEPGSTQYNEMLALQRAQAVFDHLRSTVDQDPRFTSNSLYAQIRVEGRGETQPVVAMEGQADNALNRRVEIGYRLKVVFPQPDGANVPRSRYWKVDFAAGGGGGTSLGPKTSIGLEAGIGSLTMLPDAETGQTQTIEKLLTYEMLGVSVGLLSYLRNLKFLMRFPRVRRLIQFLDPTLGGNYKRTEDFLKTLGFSTDLASEGGEFTTDEPLSFAEMAKFNFATVSASLSLAASGAGSLIMLHSPYFFTYVVIYGGGLKISFPDASLNFVPAAWVQVQV